MIIIVVLHALVQLQIVLFVLEIESNLHYAVVPLEHMIAVSPFVQIALIFANFVMGLYLHNAPIVMEIV